MKSETKAVYLLERTKDSTSNIIGFYSSEELAIAAVKRHVVTTIDDAVSKAHHESEGQHTGIYIQEGFMISRNDVEVDDDVDFEKIEDPDEFHIGVDVAEEHHPAEDLGDVKDNGLYGKDEVPLG